MLQTNQPKSGISDLGDQDKGVPEGGLFLGQMRLGSENT